MSLQSSSCKYPVPWLVDTELWSFSESENRSCEGERPLIFKRSRVGRCWFDCTNDRITQEKAAQYSESCVNECDWVGFPLHLLRYALNYWNHNNITRQILLNNTVGWAWKCQVNGIDNTNLFCKFVSLQNKPAQISLDGENVENQIF